MTINFSIKNLMIDRLQDKETMSPDKEFNVLLIWVTAR